MVLYTFKTIVWGALSFLCLETLFGDLTQAQVPSESASFYYGSVKYTSPDGNVPYGNTVSLVKRTVRPNESLIFEVVLQPSRKSGEKPVEFVTMISRRGSTAVFDVTDDRQTFNGTITFEC